MNAESVKGQRRDHEDERRRQTILVTGASGMIGGAVVAMLAGEGHRVRAVSRNPRGATGDRTSAACGDVFETPAPGAGPEAWADALEGIDHVVHCAGIAAAGLPNEAYARANVQLTADLAVAAARRIAGTFVYISSIRAVAGRSVEGIVSEETPTAPDDAYGRSKLEGEKRVRAAFDRDARFTILRPVPVYGLGMGGNLAALLRLAATPFPLPLAGLEGRRSFLDLEACAGAVRHALDHLPAKGAAYIVSDRHPSAVPEIVAAVRRAGGRSTRLFRVQPSLMQTLARAIGQGDKWRGITGSLVADCSALAATGWRPVDDTPVRIGALAALRRNGADTERP